MKWQNLLVLYFILFISACITERSGVALPEPSVKEAAQINLEMGYRYLLQDDLKAAQTKLEKALEQNPRLVNAHTTLALVYERLEDQAAAETHYKRAVQIASRDPDALNSYASYLCRSKGRRAEGLEYFDRAMKVPQSVKHSNKAMLSTNAGICAKATDLVRAENYLRTALRLDASYHEALVQMADVAYRRENHLQARAFIERYLTATQASAPALWLAVRIEQALGDTRAAAQYAQRLRQDFPQSAQTQQLLQQERNAG